MKRIDTQEYKLHSNNFGYLKRQAKELLAYIDVLHAETALNEKVFEKLDQETVKAAKDEVSKEVASIIAAEDVAAA
jgi:hypothetical protein